MSAKKKKSTKPRAKAKPKVSTVEIEKFMLCSKDMDTSIYGQASSMKADGKAMTPNAIATIALKYMRTYCDSTGLEWRSMTTNTTALKEKTYDVASDQAIKDAMKLVKEAKKQKSEVNKNMSDASRARKSVRRKAQPKKK
jgi:hypothetical protein